MGSGLLRAASECAAHGPDDVRPAVVQFCTPHEVLSRLPRAPAASACALPAWRIMLRFWPELWCLR